MTTISVDIECPCGAVIAVPIVIELSKLSTAGEQRMTCEPDLADLWAHSFTHPTNPGGGLPLTA